MKNKWSLLSLILTINFHQWAVALYYNSKITGYTKILELVFRIIGGSSYLGIFASISAYMIFIYILS